MIEASWRTAVCTACPVCGVMSASGPQRATTAVVSKCAMCSGSGLGACSAGGGRRGPGGGQAGEGGEAARAAGQGGYDAACVSRGAVQESCEYLVSGAEGGQGGVV